MLTWRTCIFAALLIASGFVSAQSPDEPSPEPDADAGEVLPASLPVDPLAGEVDADRVLQRRIRELQLQRDVRAGQVEVARLSQELTALEEGEDQTAGGPVSLVSYTRVRGTPTAVIAVGSTMVTVRSVGTTLPSGHTVVQLDGRVVIERDGERLDLGGAP